MDISCETQQTELVGNTKNEKQQASAVDLRAETTSCLSVQSHHPRQPIKPASSSSESDASEDSDDDEVTWKRRKLTKKTSSNTAMLNSRTCEEFAICAAKFSEDRRQAQKSNGSKFNVWSNVLAEQGLVEDLNSVGVEFLRQKNDRGCEGYNYALKNKHQGGYGKPIWQQDSKEIHRRLGCKRSAKERLGELSILKKNKRDFNISENDSDEVVINGIATILREPKQELIARIVKTLGKKRALEILAMTEDIEDGGGMLVADGSRRRTPGGTFLLLVRNDYDITRDELDAIFEPDRKLQAMAKKDIVRARRRKAAILLSNAQELPELPTLPELLLKEHETKLRLAEEMETKKQMEMIVDDMLCDSDKEPGEIDSD